MANKRIKKKINNRVGRKKNVPNMIKTDSGSLVNQHGVKFTPEEKRALESAVNSANRKRARMLKEEGQLPRKVNGAESGESVESLQLMGKESDFIIAKRSKSLQRFKTHEQFERYLENTRRVTNRNYIDIRVKQYKDNYIKAIEGVFGHDADDVVDKIKKMPTRDYMRMVQADETLEIGFPYGPEGLSGKLNQIRASLGMTLMEEPIPEEMDG